MLCQGLNNRFLFSYVLQESFLVSKSIPRKELVFQLEATREAEETLNEGEWHRRFIRPQGPVLPTFVVS